MPTGVSWHVVTHHTICHAYQHLCHMAIALSSFWPNTWFDLKVNDGIFETFIYNNIYAVEKHTLDKESNSQADNFGSREHGSETEETSGDLFTATLWSNCHPAEWEDAGKTRDRDVFTNIETADHLSSPPALYPFASHSHRHQYNKKLIRGVEELRIVLSPPKYALWSSVRGRHRH